MLSLSMMVKNLFKQAVFYKTEFLVLVLYLILTIVMLYPFSILEINTQIIGMDAGDTYQGIWSLWWVKHSVLSLSNPYTTDYIFNPVGTDLYSHTLSPAAGIFSIPFQLTLGLVSSYNLLIILSFVLSGYGAFRLAQYVTGNKSASFFAGLVYGFSTYHFARAWGQQNLTYIQWIPFYILFLLKLRNEPSGKNIVYASFFFILTIFWGDFQYGIFIGLFTLMLFTFDFIFRKAKFRKYLRRFIMMMALTFGVIAVILGPFLLSLLNGQYNYAWSASYNNTNDYSVDFVAFFVPNALNLFFGKYSTGLIEHFSNPWIEGIVYIGYTALILSLFAVVKSWKTSKLWIAGAVTFSILALGSTLHIYGSNIIAPFNITIPLPEAVYSSIFPIPRASSRFIVMAMLSVAIVSAISLRRINCWLAKFSHGKMIRIMLLLCLSLTLLGEVNMIPFPLVENPQVPAFYSDLALIVSEFAVLDLPQNYDASARWMYFQTVSEKPIVVGSLSRVSPVAFNYLEAFPIIGQMKYAEQGKSPENWTDIINTDQNNANLNAFYNFNVKYVVLHRDLTNNLTFSIMNDYLYTLLGNPVFCDDRVIAYQTKVFDINGSFTFLTNGWAPFEDNTKLRWIEENAAINIVTPLAQTYNVSFSAATQVKDKRLQVFLNDEKVGDFQIYVNEFSPIVLSLQFKEGLNSLSFYSDDYFVPANIIANNTDTRHLSIAIQNITIAPN